MDHKLLQTIFSKATYAGICRFEITLQKKIEEQVKEFGLELFLEQRALFEEKKEVSTSCFTSLCEVEPLPQGDVELETIGCVLLAGGDGSRLGLDGPKGCFEIEGMGSLFSIFANKIKKDGNTYLAIMTSSKNHEATIAHFKKNQYFNLDEERVDFFMQKSLPLLDQDGYWFLDENQNISVAPNGNGEALSLFHNSPIFGKWQNLQIKNINVVPIDNCLANPCIKAICGKDIDVLIQGVEKKEGESLGVLVQDNMQKVSVIEYLYLQEEMENTKPSIGYSGMFSVTMSFIQKVSGDYIVSHLVEKKGKKADYKGSFWESTETKVWKMEKFIFDLFIKASKVKIFKIDREFFFSPIKCRACVEKLQDLLQKEKVY